MIKKIFFTLLTFAPVTASAQGIQIRFNNPTNVTSVSELIGIFVDWIIQLGIVAVVLFFIYTGFQFVAARGNPDAIDKAKKSFLWTVVGTLVLIGAKVLVEVIKNTLEQGGITG